MKEWSDFEVVPISAISHHLYCPRQNALIHTEGVFSENELTVSGSIGHKFVDEEKSYMDHGTHKETSYRVFSEELGITGIADIIEFPDSLPPYPIDYKNGKIASWENQEAQLCAVALCLEEMFDVNILHGAIYHIQSKKRHEVEFSNKLRNLTKQAISEIRNNLINNYVPERKYSKICDLCSLFNICLPKRKTQESIFKPVKYG